MPARKSSVSAKVVISRKAKTTKGKAKEAVEVDAKAEVKKVVKTVAEEITPADLFQTFTTDIKLQCGLNIVRSLGGDKYEVINLDFASANTIGSKEFAEFIKNVPERLAAMTIDKKQWDGAITKCSVAVRVTEKNLFRLFSLPSEVRLDIIKLIVVPANGMRYRAKGPDSNALSLMLTCRQLNDEIKTVFLKNNSFYIDHMDFSAIKKAHETAQQEAHEKGQPKIKDFVPTHPFLSNVQKLTYSWKDNCRDPFAFNIIKKLPKLEELNLEIQHYNFDLRKTYVNHNLNRNYSCPDDPSFGDFRKLYGVDALLEIRGLTKVNIKVLKVPVAEKQKFENYVLSFSAYLTKELAQERRLPKPAPAPIEKDKTKAIKMDVGSEVEEFDGEPQEAVYIPRQSRTRAAKVVQRFGFESDTTGLPEAEDGEDSESGEDGEDGDDGDDE